MRSRDMGRLLSSVAVKGCYSRAHEKVEWHGRRRDKREQAHARVQLGHKRAMAPQGEHEAACEGYAENE